PCLCRTHISRAVTKALKVWSLVAKLEKNCQIEDENTRRDDLAAYPDPGSEAASFITIDDEDIQALHTPSFADKFPEIPMFIQKILASFEAKDSNMKKRDTNNAKLPSDMAREAK
ncbi:hypothetical protein IW261DRAFT_1316754, partial [Armillaria novae-zelandiae]